MIHLLHECNMIAGSESSRPVEIKHTGHAIRLMPSTLIYG